MQSVAWPAIAALLRDPDTDVRILACELVRDMPGETAAAFALRPARVGAGAQRLRGGRRSARGGRRSRGAARARALRGAFRGTPFLEFAIKIAIDRIRSQATEPTCLSFRRSREEEFRRLCEFLYRRTGMVFTEAKRYYVERRVVERMQPTQAAFVRRLLRAAARRPAGRDRAVRQRVHGQRNVLLPRRPPARVPHRRPAGRQAARRRRAASQIRIWSVPCSTGEEPYSIAIWLLENWPLVDQYEIEIVGSDIDTDVLDAGARRRVRQTRADAAVARSDGQVLRARRSETWQIIDDLRDSVRFTAAEHRRAGATTSARAVRRDLLPQCSDLLRRCFATHRGGEPL